MYKRFIGIKYQFEPHFRPYENGFDFRLLAMHRRSRRYSTINTLNRILSWCEIEEDDRRFQESSWLISKPELERLLHLIEEIVDNRKYLLLLEADLDQDRSCGEWENIRRKQIRKPRSLKKRR